MAPRLSPGDTAGKSKIGGGIIKGIVMVSVGMDDGTTVNLTGEIDLATRTFIVAGRVESAGEFSDEHGVLLQQAFKCLAGTDYKETLIQVDDDQQEGPAN